MRKRTAVIPLVGGLDTRTAPQLALAPKVTSATNLYRARSAEWTKRFGFHYLPNVRISQDGGSAPFTFAKARALGARGDQLVLLDKKRWWYFSALRQGFVNLTQDSTGDGLDIDQRVVTHDLNLSLHSATEGAESAYVVDSAVGGGYVCTIWQTDQNQIKIVFTELATGAYVGKGSATTGVTRRPKVVYIDNRFVVFTHTQGGAACTLHADHWNSADAQGPFYIGGNNLSTDLMGTSTGEPWYDVQVRANGNILVAYRSTAPSVKALEWNPTSRTAAIAAATVVAGDVAANAIGWVYNSADVGSSPRLLTATSGATGVVGRNLDSATLTQLSSTTILASPGDVASITGRRDTGLGDTVAFWELRVADTTLTSIVEGHTVGPTNRTFMGIGCLATKPFLVDGADWYIGVTKPWELQPGYFIVPARHMGSNQRVPPGVTARILPGAGMSLPPERNALSHVPGVSTTKFVFPCMRIYDFIVQSSTPSLILYRQAAYATVDFDGVLPRPVSYSRTLLAPGSVCKTYPGEAVADAGWLVAPEAPVLASGGAGGLTGSFKYRVVFAYTDGEGRVWRSAPSPAATFAATANLISVTFKYAFLSSAWVGLNYGTTIGQVEIYRTKANGTTYFRLPGGFGSLPYPMLGTAQTTNFNDNTQDSLLEQQRPLYTDGGELFNEAAPPCISMAVVGDRVVGIPAEERTAIVASKAIEVGFGLGFHPDLRVPIVSDGDNYAVSAMEGRTIVFKRQAIYMLTGDWPTNTGTGSLPISQRIAVGFGTIEQESVRESDQGIWFKDPSKGMCLLTRGLEVVQLGKPVQENDTADVVGVEVAEDDEQVRALLSNRKILIWDYLEKQWATWEINPSLGTPTCSAVVGGIYYQGFSNGRVAFYNIASYNDLDASGSVQVAPSITMRFDMAGKEGVYRLYRATVIGRRISSPELNATFTTDYGAGSEVKAAFFPADQSDGTWAHTLKPRVQRATTHLLTLSFSTSLGGYTFIAVAVEFGLRDTPGLRRLPPGSIS